MPDSVAERVGHNESVMREINERIEAGLWPSNSDSAVFCCECAVLRCTELIELTLSEYEEVRSNPARWFVLVPGHELPAHEAIVRRCAEHIVVEKFGDAAAQAEAEDPRDDGPS